MAPGQGPNTDDSADALFVLNAMVEAWNIDRTAIYTIRRDVYNLTGGQQVYTIGPGGDFNVARPLQIENAGLIITDGVEYPMALMDSDGWARINVKNVGSNFPEGLYNDKAFPISNLSLWPMPQTGFQLALYTWSVLAQFSAVSDEVVFPPGYADALRYNLAVRLGIEWGRPARAEVLDLARTSLARIKRKNLPRPLLGMDPALVSRGVFNIQTGQPLETPSGP
jgi:hypothetical protein